MAGDIPVALWRTQRRRRPYDLDQPAKKAPAPAASTRKSSRATGAAQKKPATTTRTAARAARTTKKSKASVTESSIASSAPIHLADMSSKAPITSLQHPRCVIPELVRSTALIMDLRCRLPDACNARVEVRDAKFHPGYYPRPGGIEIAGYFWKGRISRDLLATSPPARSSSQLVLRLAAARMPLRSALRTDTGQNLARSPCPTEQILVPLCKPTGRVKEAGLGRSVRRNRELGALLQT